ncbi:MAG: hypothetical protein V7K97_13220 [Nostoc sp.]|uniref:hypothetical protein n=1 Tax=Nostoc sp. TaxID=1180 RepID=UPI002FFCD2B4
MSNDKLLSFVFEVFCKAIAHSWTTGDRFIFEVFCKAIPTVSYANAHSWRTSDRFVFEVFCKATPNSPS